MTRAWIGAALPCGVLLLSTTQAPQLPTFRAATDFVAIDVSVHRGNRPVPGLVAEDFTVLDNGVPQHAGVETVDAVPLDVSLVFDQNNSAQELIGLSFVPDLAKIAALLRSSDRLRAISFATDVREVLAMQSPTAWNRSVAGVTAIDTAAKLMRAGRPDENGWDFRHDPKVRGESLFDALLLAIARPADPGRRHVVIAFVLGANSQGVLNDGPFFDVVAARSTALLHVALWSRRYGNGISDAPNLEYTRLAIQAATAATGGDVHDARDVVGTFKTIFADIRQNYVLHYTLTGVPPAGWHTVIVKLPNHPEDAVRARSGYLGR